MKKAQECMLSTMTIDNWLEVELIRGIYNPTLQKRLLQESDPILKDMVRIAMQWQSAEDVMTQFIIDNKASEHESEPEEVNGTPYGRTPNQTKGPVTGNLEDERDRNDKENATQANRQKRGMTGDTIVILDDETDVPDVKTIITLREHHSTGDP